MVGVVETYHEVKELKQTVAEWKDEYFLRPSRIELFDLLEKQQAHNASLQEQLQALDYDAKQWRYEVKSALEREIAQELTEELAQKQSKRTAQHYDDR